MIARCRGAADVVACVGFAHANGLAGSPTGIAGLTPGGGFGWL
jgi:hypothetical protein